MKTVFLILSMVVLNIARAQDLPEYLSYEYREGNHVLQYRLLFPLPYESSKKYPLIVFLHGAFEKGNDNQAQLNIGGRYFLRMENRANYPAVVLFPQCPPNDSWVFFETKLDSNSGLAKNWNFPFKKEPTPVSRLLKHLLDSLTTEGYIDSSRVYLGGLSQGGMGVFDLVARYPEMFAAAFPICGAGKVSTAKNFADEVALWIFHGEKDDIVPCRFSREYFKQLNKLGADVKYSEYPGVFHNSWVNAFREPELLQWLFSKAKKTK
jgi:predicted peptidase